MLFELEVILSSFAVRQMSAVVVASVAAAVTSRSLVREEALLRSSSYAVEDPRELLAYAGMAVLAVLAACLFLRLLRSRFSRSANARPGWLRPGPRRRHWFRFAEGPKSSSRTRRDG